MIMGADLARRLIAKAFKLRTDGDRPDSRSLPARPPKIRPVFALQSRVADCGYICVAVVCAAYGRPADPVIVKQRAGSGVRGATIRQVRDMLRDWGLRAEVVKYGINPDDLPCPGIVLFDGSHYVVVARRRGKIFECYFPEQGWQKVAWERLSDHLNGYGVLINSGSEEKNPVSEKGKVPTRRRSPMARLFMREGAVLLRSRRAIDIVTVGILAQVVALSTPLFSMKIVDAVQAGRALGPIQQLCLGLLAISLLSTLASILSTTFSHRFVRDISTYMSRRIFDVLARKDVSWFEDINPRSISNAIAACDRVIGVLSELLAAFAGLIISVAVGLVALLFFSPWLVVPGIIMATLRFGVDRFFDDAQSAAASQAIACMNKRDAYTMEVVSRMPMLVRQGDAPRGAVRYMRLVKKTAVAVGQANRVISVKTVILSNLGAIENIVFVAMGAMLMKSGSYSLGGFVAAGVYKDLLSRSIEEASRYLSRIKTTELHIRQAEELFEGAERPPGRGSRLRTGKIELSDVSFRYSALERDILAGANLVVQPGETTAIVGPSGSGKTTIAKLIVGAREPTSGAILLDGNPAAFPVVGLGAVLQGDVLITGSIRDNICLMRRGISDADIIDALRIAEALEFVSNLPMGLETSVGETIGGLSGGQKQRLLIARAILTKPKALILDEATSALDPETEERVLSNIKACGGSVLLISHRPEAWAQADVVYAMKNALLVRRPAQASRSGSMALPDASLAWPRQGSTSDNW